MNPTKLLCKYLDRECKGYVTIGNLVTATSGLAALSIIGMCYVRGASAIVEHWNGKVLDILDTPIRDAGIIDSVCIAVTMVGTAFLLAIILAFVLTLSQAIIVDAWAVKIAKCERKDGDE